MTRPDSALIQEVILEGLKQRIRLAQAEQCPLDGREFVEANAVPLNCDISDLGQHRVHCVNACQGCSFAGKLCELKEHLARCVSDRVECAKCKQRVVRSDAVNHRRDCPGDPSRRLIGSSEGRSIGEGLVHVRMDIETLRELVTSDRDADAVVNEANALVERIKRIEAQLLRPDACGRDSETDAGLYRPWPFRRATKPRSQVAVCSFGDMYGAHDSLKEKKDVVITGRVITLAGYTFQVDCHFENDRSRWLVTHVRDEKRDIRLVLRPEAEVAALALKKPIPNRLNASIKSEKVLWASLETAGFIDNDSLYLNIELE
ncbi:hypothetical protein HPB48_009258 [Haemaphysalis longicornis]|uniref:Uncharacterized protein n=1 Tax=Haemaphysalis longicornis TaxID=44386 RepID=A0A9J6G634_HAELO|nr:hypothetical protein HPB48_009258 [Haemaphysalis longicornis]